MYYYLYIDPNQWVISQMNDHPVINYQADQVANESQANTFRSKHHFKYLPERKRTPIRRRIYDLL